MVASTERHRAFPGNGNQTCFLPVQYFPWTVDALCIPSDGEVDQRLCWPPWSLLSQDSPIAVRKACVRQRLANSILNLFTFALHSQRSFRCLGVTPLPVCRSSSSPSGDRPRSGSDTAKADARARDIPPETVSTTATDASANSYDAHAHVSVNCCFL